MRNRRYEARKVVAGEREHAGDAWADSVDALVAAVHRLDSPGRYRIYDLQPPDPGISEQRAGGDILSDGSGTRLVARDR